MSHKTEKSSSRIMILWTNVLLGSADSDEDESASAPRWDGQSRIQAGVRRFIITMLTALSPVLCSYSFSALPDLTEIQSGEDFV